MSGVDVLAVMLADYVDASIERQWDDYAPQLAADSEEARAAVAELMDKADSLLTLGASDTGIRELRAALVRCKGGAA